MHDCWFIYSIFGKKGKSSLDALVIILKNSVIPKVKKQAYLECLITNKICCRF